jgi:hypothetical protein
LPKTSSGKIAKHLLVAEMRTSTAPCFDRVSGTWMS